MSDIFVDIRKVGEKYKKKLAESIEYNEEAEAYWIEYTKIIGVNLRIASDNVAA